jgi:hypothetical protein
MRNYFEEMIVIDLYVDYVGGYCPVQAWGTIKGKQFYFRAKGSHWQIGIGGDTLRHPEWTHREKYPGGEFDAGFMSEEEALKFINFAAETYIASLQKSTV